MHYINTTWHIGLSGLLLIIYYIVHVLFIINYMSSMSQHKHVSNNDIERYESSIHKNEPVFSVNVNVVHRNIASFVNIEPGNMSF